MAKQPKRPRDANQLAKLITDIATGEAENTKPSQGGRGAAGGLVGGKARANALDPQRRQEIAQKAAAARWAKKPA
jgi:hypothetical protein